MSYRRPSVVAFVLVFAPPVLLVGCGGSAALSDSSASNGPSGPIAPTPVTITVQPASPSITVGATLQLSASVAGATGATTGVDQGVTWQSQSPSLISVDATGLVKGLAVGKGTINARSKVTSTTFGVTTVTVTP